MFKRNFKNLVVCPLLIASSLGFTTAFAQTVSKSKAKSSYRRSSLPPKLLKKVLKKRNHKKVSKKKGSKFDSGQLTSRFASWGISPSNKKSSINLTGAWKNFEKRKDIVVAVIDTGIDPKHPFLKNNMYVPKGTPSATNFGIDFSKNRAKRLQPHDQHGHGTHVAGIIKSVFPGVKILTLKYYNPQASGQDNLNSTIKALEYAVNSNVDIINYSGGGPEPALEELRILKQAEKKGILVVAAAGNEESNIDNKNNAYYPASYGLKNIITVTAHDQSVRMLNSSNYGRRSVDLSAPGYRIKSALPNGRAGYLTGTSQATAFVSGVAALMKSQFPELTTMQVKDIINKSAKKEVSLLSRCVSGGRLDATKAQLMAAQYVKQTNQTRGLAKKKKARKKISVRKPSAKNGIIYRFAN